MSDKSKYQINIDYTKFIFAVLVVFIHTNGREQLSLIQQEQYSMFLLIKSIISLLTSLAVPGFFMISGYLMFNGCERFDLETYVSKIKKRLHTLLIPFVVWNMLKLISLLLISGYHEGYSGITHTAESYGWWRAFWDGNPDLNSPVLLATWFIRDLMVFSVASPIIYLAIKHLGTLWVLLLFVLHALGLWPTTSVCAVQGLAFYSLGCYLAQKRMEFSTLLSKQIYALLLATTLVLAILTRAVAHPIIMDLYVISGIFTTIYSLGLLKEYTRFRLPAICLESTTYIYFGHSFLILSGVFMVVSRIIHFSNEWGVILRYLITPLVTVGLLLMIYRYIICKSSILQKMLIGRMHASRPL